MTSAAYSVHPALAVAAEVVLPVTGALALIPPAVEWRAGRLKSPLCFWICALISIALVYILRHFFHAPGKWIEPGLIYSTHTALAISFGVTLAARRLAMLPFVAAAIAGYLWLITYLHYHIPGDVISTAAVFLPLSVLCHLPWLLWRQRGR